MKKNLKKKKKEIFKKKKQNKRKITEKKKQKNKIIKNIEEEKNIEILIPNKNLTIKELSELILVDKNKIDESIKKLKLKNKEIIKPHKAILISDYLNIITKLNNEYDYYEEKKYTEETKKPIIITIIGNVDNGKTTLINKICDNKIEKKKYITQGININWININKYEFIFLDTPGHKDLENFKNFSLKISDIIILVINYNEILNIETINLIKSLEEKKINLIININKIDLSQKEIFIIDKLKKFKIENKLNFEINKTSIKNEETIENLKKKIYKLKKYINDINVEEDFEGLVIENNISKNSKITTTLFINSGNVKKNDIIISETNYIKIKNIYNYKNEKIKESKYNPIIKIEGFNEAPKINSVLTILPNEKITKHIYKFRKYKEKILKSQNKNLNQKEILNKCENPGDTPNLNLIIKANSNRILESLEESILGLKTKSFNIKFIKLSTGDINISDIKLTKDTKSHLIIFNINLKENIKKIIKEYNLNILCTNIIYEVLNYIEKIDSKSIFFESENILGIAKINKIFNILNKIIIGCIVIQGKAKIKSQIKIFRNEIEIYKGNIDSLKYLKNNVIEVKKGLECGIFIKNYKNFLIDDIIKFYKI